MSRREEALISLVIAIIIEAILFVPMGTVWTELFKAIGSIPDIIGVEMPITWWIGLKALEFLAVYSIVFIIMGIFYNVSSSRR